MTLCHRCDKNEATTNVGIADPDLRPIPVCEECKPLVLMDLMHGELFLKKGACKAYLKAFERDPIPQPGLGDQGESNV